MTHHRLTLSFYTRDDVTLIARELLGKRLVSFADGRLTSGYITETEAYKGIIDKASHAYGNRRTKRTETMFSEGGIAYIYFCYGMHSLLNVVTNHNGIPHAVLIRAILPETGMNIMTERIGRQVSDKDGVGPGRVTKLLGLTFADDKEDLVKGNKIWIEDAGIEVPDTLVKLTPRIGVSYAGEDALLPYRFVITQKELAGLVKSFL